jgi:leucyl-tRNA synthetase
MLRDLQTKEGLREILGVKEEWVQGFDPIPLIDVEGLGDLCAKTVVEEMKIQSHKDATKLDEAKDKCYQAGFDTGVMKVGECAGMKVELAKPLVRKQMIEMGVAVPYYEPEKEVKARTGEDCIVALCDQWLLDYGEESWKNKVKEHVSSDRFQTSNPKTQKEFDDILEWLKEWGCSRTTGLGTRVPWDEQFVIESLSDSTIYTAYYTIAHLLQGGKLEGSEIGPAGIPADAMTIGAFDYVFLDKPYDAEQCPGVTEE